MIVLLRCGMPQKKGWKPPEKNYPKKKWLELKNNNKTSAIKGFVGHANTFRGQFFDSYFKHQNQKIKTNSQRVVKVAKILKSNNVTIKKGSYIQFSGLKGYVIYCDPPYSKTVSRYYHGNETNVSMSKFDSEDFWNWCRNMAEDNIVFVSEYKAPKDFEKIWSKTSCMTGNIHKSKGKKGNKRTENLYLF